MVGWYLDVIVGYLIRLVIRLVKAHGTDAWPVEKAKVSASSCPPAPYGGPFAEVCYTYVHEGGYFSGIHRRGFILRSSAEDYAARFPTDSGMIVRLKPRQPETSIVCDEDQIRTSWS